MGHPTSLLSPDWPGATRLAVEEEVGGVCVFVLGACGETSCIQAHQGDPDVTDRDGRRVGLAACSALSSGDISASILALSFDEGVTNRKNAKGDLTEGEPNFPGINKKRADLK